MKEFKFVNDDGTVVRYRVYPRKKMIEFLSENGWQILTHEVLEKIYNKHKIPHAKQIMLFQNWQMKMAIRP